MLGPRRLFLRSDNAGCYHNQVLFVIASYFAKKYGHIMVRYDFCEPQTGKDVCDRKIAPIKRTINQYINDAHDVINAHDMKDAIESNSSLNSVMAFVCEMNDSLDFKTDFKLKNITQFHSFVYSNDSICLFRFYNVGSGVDKKIESLMSMKNVDLVKKVKNACLTIKEKSKDKRETIIKVKNEREILKCDHCDHIFFSKVKLENHLIDHDKQQKMPQIDKIKLQYASLIKEIRTQKEHDKDTLKNENIESLMNNKNKLNSGFALKTRKNKRFNDKQITYLKKHFDEGKKTGRKVNPDAVEKQMIEMWDTFTEDERLDSRQIKSYFSRQA